MVRAPVDGRAAPSLACRAVEPFLYDEFYAIERTHWWTVGMRGVCHALLAAALRGVARPRLLDAGCGTGVGLEEFGRYGWICGIDVAGAALAYSRRRDSTLPLIQASLVCLPFGSGALDAVLALDVLEHLDDDGTALREIRRVLRPGGIALLNVPAFASLWSEKDAANHHRRRYTRRTLRHAVEEAGLRVERLTYTNAALFPAIWCVRQIQRRARLGWNSRGEYHPRPWLNRALLGLLRAERHALRAVNLPFGTSVTCVARRPPADLRSAS